MKKIATKDVRPYVEQGIEFMNNNNQLWSRWETYGSEMLYVVYSYGPHWPLFIFDPTNDVWYGNEDKYSSTTTRHRTYTEPRGVHIEWRDSRIMKELAQNGLTGSVRNMFRRAA